VEVEEGGRIAASEAGCVSDARALRRRIGRNLNWVSRVPHHEPWVKEAHNDCVRGPEVQEDGEEGTE